MSDAAGAHIEPEEIRGIGNSHPHASASMGELPLGPVRTRSLRAVVSPDAETIPAGRLLLGNSASPHLLGSATSHVSQIKSRERVRDLAEVYTHKREVDAMLALVPEMFPSDADPGNSDRTFLEPACGSGNFLEEILRRKLAFVTTRRYGRGERYEHRILRCLASVYGIDISPDNVEESRDRMRAVINSHLDLDLNTQAVSPEFAVAAEVILTTNILCADTLADTAAIELVQYRPGRSGCFTREWSSLESEPDVPDLFSTIPARRDERPVHYSELRANPGPVTAAQEQRVRP